MHGGVFDHGDGAEPLGFLHAEETDSCAAVIDRAGWNPSREEPIGERGKKYCGQGPRKLRSRQASPYSPENAVGVPIERVSLNQPQALSVRIEDLHIWPRGKSAPQHILLLQPDSELLKKAR
jgi:hypothetical protein